MIFELPLSYYAYSGLINAVACGAIAAAVFYKQPRSTAARLFSLLALLITIWSWFYFLWLQVTTDADRAHWLFRTCMLPVVLMPPVFLHFATALTGRVQQRGLLVGNYLLSIAIAPTVYTPWFSRGVAAHLVFPFWGIPGPAFFLHLSQMVFSLGVGLWILAATARSAEGLFQRQIWWTFWAYLIGWFSGCTNYLEWLRIPIPPVLNPLVSLYVAAIAYAIVRHQLMDIRFVIRRSVVYSLLIAAITAAYLVMVLIMEKWFQGFFGYRSILATVVVAFLIAVFFNPLRHLIQSFIDRAFFSATPTELAEQREQLLSEIRKSDQMKAVATLAAGLAHEIKNPLTSIKTFTESLEAHHSDPAFRAKFQKIIGGEVERINLIVHRLLEFAKPVPPKLEPLDVTQIIDETLDFLSNELLKQRVEVQRSYAVQPAILGDSQQLKQVFLNLFLNSLQAMDGQGCLEVATAIERSDLVVRITDNGAGIAPEHLANLFKPFFTTKSGGTGLGLAVVQGIVKEHGGRIEVASGPGRGTTITLRLPVAV